MFTFTRSVNIDVMFESPVARQGAILIILCACSFSLTRWWWWRRGACVESQRLRNIPSFVPVTSHDNGIHLAVDVLRRALWRRGVRQGRLDPPLPAATLSLMHWPSAFVVRGSELSTLPKQMKMIQSDSCHSICISSRIKSINDLFPECELLYRLWR